VETESLALLMGSYDRVGSHRRISSLSIQTKTNSLLPTYTDGIFSCHVHKLRPDDRIHIVIEIKESWR